MGCGQRSEQGVQGEKSGHEWERVSAGVKVGWLWGRRLGCPGAMSEYRGKGVGLGLVWTEQGYNAGVE